MKRKIRNISDYKNYDDWVADILKNNKKQADDFLKLTLNNFKKDGDLPSLLLALRQVTKAKGGFLKLADKTGIARESLYSILSKNGNPTISNFVSILSALSCKMNLEMSKNN